MPEFSLQCTPFQLLVLTSLPSCRFGCSKWAGEVLLRQMHDDFNIPASIFRCGMLLPHSR